MKELTVLVLLVLGLSFGAINAISGSVKEAVSNVVTQTTSCTNSSVRCLSDAPRYNDFRAKFIRVN